MSPGLAAAMRGEETGIACSDVPVGGGVNAENIRKCLALLKETALGRRRVDRVLRRR